MYVSEYKMKISISVVLWHYIGVPTNHIKDAAKSIARPLIMIFNAYLAKGLIPNVWKFAKIIPIFKCGARNETNNYRPISVLSLFAKLLKKLYMTSFPTSSFLIEQ